MADPAPQKKSKLQTFRERLLSTVILWALMIAAFVVGDRWVFYLMFVALQTLGTIEFFRLFADRGMMPFLAPTLGLGLAYTGLSYIGGAGMVNVPFLPGLDGVLIALLVILLIFGTLRSSVESDGDALFRIVLATFGLAYLTIMFGFTLRVFDLPALVADPDGPSSPLGYLMFLFAVTKFTDMGAYALGSLFGKHKMIPKISPGKTWEGFGGALFGAQVAAFGLYFFWGDSIPLLTPVHVFALALLLAILAVVGDLAESMIKRSVRAKDSGHVMPGIGGVMDLVDSVIFTGPALYLYLLYLTQTS